MLRVGLTGGMGAGKSTVARLLAECGAVVVDADRIAREVVEPGTPGLAELVEAFGGDILRPDGTLDRPALAAKAFADDASRATLNAITHPRVGARTAEVIAAAPSDAILVQDIPLLVEGGGGALFHLVLVVMADVEERVRRLVAYRGIDEADARARIAAQASDEQRRAAADVLLDNGGAAGALDAEVRALYYDRLLPFEANIRARQWVPVDFRLTPADPAWAAQAQRAIGRLHVACGADALRIDHVGPTAVPGLDAKDVLDVQITVADLAATDGLADRLAAAGFPAVATIAHDDPRPTAADPAGIDATPWAKRVHAAADPGRPVHVHIRADGAPGQRFALILRDWLRAEPAVAAEHLEVERDAAAKASGLPWEQAREVYLDARRPWFDAAYPRALAWAAATDAS